MYIMVCYDIANDRRRRRIRRVLKSYGNGFQESVFEADVDRGQFAALQQKVLALIEPDDKVRFYTLCGACTGRASGEPAAEIKPKPTHWII